MPQSLTMAFPGNVDTKTAIQLWIPIPLPNLSIICKAAKQSCPNWLCFEHLLQQWAMHLQNYYDWYHLVKIVLEPAVFSFLHYFFPFFPARMHYFTVQQETFINWTDSTDDLVLHEDLCFVCVFFIFFNFILFFKKRTMYLFFHFTHESQFTSSSPPILPQHLTPHCSI